MDPITIVLGLVVAAVVIAMLTPQGRKALMSVGNTVGSLFGQGAENIVTADSQRVELQARTEAEASAALQEAQNANARAQEILQQYEAQRKELAQWEANRDKAADTLRRLLADDVADAEQQRQIGQATGIGETALAKIAGLQAAIKMNAENVTWAHDAMNRSEELMRVLPQRASELLAQGDVAAAAQELAKAETSLAASQSAFSDSKAARLLADMNRRAGRAKANAKAAQTRATAAPASASIAAQQLDSLGGGTGSFMDYVKSTAASEAK